MRSIGATRVRILLLSAAIGLMACGDGGKPHNFAVRGIEVIGDGGGAVAAALPGGPVRAVEARGVPVAGVPPVQIGHPVQLELELYSWLDARNVTVDLFVLDRNGYGQLDPGELPPNPVPPAERDDPEGNDGERIRVGQATIERLREGTHRYRVSILMPYSDSEIPPYDPDQPPSEEPTPVWDPIEPGEYYLYAEIDPEDRFAETNERDNSPASRRFASGARVVELRADFRDVPKVFFENVQVEIPMLDLEELGTLLLPDPEGELQPEPDFCGVYAEDDPLKDVLENVADTYIGVTAWLGASGALWVDDRPAPIPSVDVMATLILEGTEYPVRAWDSASGEYRDTITVPQIVPGVSTKVHLDFRLDPAQALQAIDQFDRCLLLPPREPGLGLLVDCREPGDAVVLAECLDRIDEIRACVNEIVRSSRVETHVVAYDGVGPGRQPIPDIVDLPGFPLTDSWPPDPDDPATWPPVEIVFVPPPLAIEPLPEIESFESSFEKGFGGRFASAGVSFQSGLGIDGEGAFAGVDGRVPVGLFGGRFDLYKVDLDARGLNDALLDHNFVSYDIFVPTSFTSRIALAGTFPNSECGGSFQLGGEDCVREKCFEPDQGCASCQGLAQLRSKNPQTIADCRKCNECKRSECLSYGVAAFVERDFVVGIVPLTAAFAAQALVGLNATANFPECLASQPSELEFFAGPFADAAASLDAGIGSSTLGFAAGVGAEVTLLNDTFYARASVVDLDHTLSEVSGTLQQDVSNTLTGPNGTVYLWAGYPCIKFCRKWGIPYPCGLRQCTKRRTLDSFETFEKKDRLFCEEKPDVVVVR